MPDIQNIKVRIVADADFSDLDKSLQKLTAEEKALKDQLKGVDEAAKQAGDSLANETENANKAAQKTKASFSDLKGEIKSLAQNIPGAFQVQQILNFTKSLQGATAATGGMSGAMGVLRTAILATGIGALVIALASVVAYFTQTERGADKLAKIMSVLGVVVDQLVNLLSLLGDVVVQAFELWLKGAEAIYDFLTSTLFKALETLGSALSSVGFEGAAEMVNKLNTTLQDGKKAIEDYTGSLIKLGEEIADLEDKLGAMTIDVALANNRLTTEIDRSLKALKNRNLTYAEGLSIIDDIAKAEKDRLKNSVDLINVELDLKEKQFLRDEGNTNKAKELFSKFVNAQITAEELLNQVRGKNKEKQVAEIAEVLNKREDAVRESLVLEERLENIRAQFADKEAARQEKLKGYYEMLNRERAKDLNLETKKTHDELKAFDDTIKHKEKLQAEYYKILDQKRKQEEQEAQEAQRREDQRIQDIIDNRVAMKQKAIELTTEIANAFFEITKQNNAQELADTQAKHQKELQAAGDNKQAQAIINQRYAKIEGELKRKQALADKEQAIFNIGIQTLVNAARALGTPPTPNIALAALTAGIGAAQIAVVAAKPLPKFNKGTKSVPGFDTGDDSIMAMLRPGEGVMPVDRMKDYRPAFNAIFDRKVSPELLNSFVMDYGRLDRAITINHSSTDISSLKSELRSMNNKLDKLQVLNVQMDQKGFKTYLSKGESKTQLENNYLRVG